MISILILYTLLTSLVFMQANLMQQAVFPLFITVFRELIGAGVLFALHLVCYRSSIFLQLSKKQWFSLIKFSLMLYGVSLVGFSYAMQYVDGVTACFVLTGLPFITALILYVKESQTLSTKKLIGLGLGFLGILPIIVKENATSLLSMEYKIWGMILFLGATVAHAYGWILGNECKKQLQGQSQLLITAWAMCISGIISYFGYILLQGNFAPIGASIYFWQLLWVFSLVTAVAYYLYMYLLQYYSVTFLSFASFTEPAIGLLIGVVLYNQPITFLSGASLALLSLGLYIFYQDEL
jgi:drug/metabolite transporter (DMT)-like permease